MIHRVLLILLIGISMQLKAQQKPLYLGVSAGVGSSYFRGNGIIGNQNTETQMIQSIPVFSGGIELIRYQTRTISFAGNFNYDQKGTLTKGLINMMGMPLNYSNWIVLNSFSLPVYMMVNKPIGPRFTFSLCGGAFASYIFNINQHGELQDSSAYPKISPNPGFDIGLLIGARLSCAINENTFVYLGVRDNVGLHNILTHENGYLNTTSQLLIFGICSKYTRSGITQSRVTPSQGNHH